MILDQEFEFAGHFINGLENHGVQPILIDRNAPYQNGVCERRGGLFKELYYKTRELHQPADLQEVRDIVHECSWAVYRPSPIDRATHLPRGYLVDSQVWLWNCSAMASRL